MDLSTTYLGLKLRTPLIPSASPLSEGIDKIKLMEDSGASAVVLHSLFEEQMEAEAGAQPPEFRITPDMYLKHIAEAKRAVAVSFSTCSSNNECSTTAAAPACSICLILSSSSESGDADGTSGVRNFIPR